MKWNKKIYIEYCSQLKSKLEEIQQGNSGQNQGFASKIKEAINKMRGGQPAVEE